MPIFRYFLRLARCSWKKTGHCAKNLLLSAFCGLLPKKVIIASDNKTLRPVFPISAKKCKKCKIFSGIFALKFCKLRLFSPTKNRHFCFCQKPLTAAVHGASLWYVAQIAEKTCRTQAKDFFFFSVINIKPKEKMPPSAR